MTRTLVKPEAERTPEERAADAERLAGIFAARRAPGTKGTDRAFLQDRYNGKQFQDDPRFGNIVRKIAKRNGVETAGRFYHGGLARYVGDPQAWVEDWHDVMSVAKKRNLTVVRAGEVVHQGEPVPPPPQKALAEDIVRETMQKMVEKDKGLATTPGKLKKLREDVINKHSFKEKEAMTAILIAENRSYSPPNPVVFYEQEDDSVIFEQEDGVTSFEPE